MTVIFIVGLYGSVYVLFRDTHIDGSPKRPIMGKTFYGRYDQ
jgi:hypothetical protein